MPGDLFVRLLLAGSVLAISACANSGALEPKSSKAHTDQQTQTIDSGAAAGGGGGGY